MSVDVYAFWTGHLKANKEALQAALEALGFQARVLHEFNEAEAFWPIDLNGFKTGVEIYLFDDLKDFPEVADKLEGRDHAALFTFGSNSAEAGTALAVAAALTKVSNALIYDPQSSEFLSMERAVADARGMFDVAVKEGAQQRED